MNNLEFEGFYHISRIAVLFTILQHFHFRNTLGRYASYIPGVPLLWG